MKKLLFVFFLSISFLAYAGSDILTDFSEKESVQASSLSITVTLSGNKLIIENAGPNTRLEIFSLLGVRVAEKIIVEAKEEIPLNLSKGYYIIKIADITKKISIK
jgi:hypothetical protein